MCCAVGTGTSNLVGTATLNFSVENVKELYSKVWVPRISMPRTRFHPPCSKGDASRKNYLRIPPNCVLMLRAYDRAHFQATTSHFLPVDRILMVFRLTVGAVAATIIVVGTVIMIR